MKTILIFFTIGFLFLSAFSFADVLVNAPQAGYYAIPSDQCGLKIENLSPNELFAQNLRVTYYSNPAIASKCEVDGQSMRAMGDAAGNFTVPSKYPASDAGRAIYSLRVLSSTSIEIELRLFNPYVSSYSDTVFIDLNLQADFDPSTIFHSEKKVTNEQTAWFFGNLYKYKSTADVCIAAAAGLEDEALAQCKAAGLMNCRTVSQSIIDDSDPSHHFKSTFFQAVEVGSEYCVYAVNAQGSRQ